MAKVKNISISAVDKIIKDTYVPSETFEWHDVQVIVKKTLDLGEMLEFVNDVVESCFGEGGNYMPEIKDFAIKSSLVEKYTNISMPQNIEHRYKIVYQTDVIDMILGGINTIQFSAILDAIEVKLSHVASTNIEMVNLKLDSAISAVEGMQENLSGLFEHVSGDDLINIVRAISSEGALDQDALVKAYISQSRSE